MPRFHTFNMCFKLLTKGKAAGIAVKNRDHGDFLMYPQIKRM